MTERDRAILALLDLGFSPAQIAGLDRMMRITWSPALAVVEVRDYLTTRQDGDPALFLSERRQRISERTIRAIRAKYREVAS